MGNSKKADIAFQKKREENLKEAWEILLELQALYRETFPPGTISKCGGYRMGDDHRWWGRCVMIPFIDEDCG